MMRLEGMVIGNFSPVCFSSTHTHTHTHTDTHTHTHKNKDLWTPTTCTTCSVWARISCQWLIQNSPSPLHWKLKALLATEHICSSYPWESPIAHVQLGIRDLRSECHMNIAPCFDQHRKEKWAPAGGYVSKQHTCFFFCCWKCASQ